MSSRSLLKSFGYLVLCFSLTACDKKFNPSDGAPPSTEVVHAGDMSLVTVDKPDLFMLVPAEKIDAPEKINVTGSVNPDIAREVPVISLASGRVVDIKARLDDYVRKGQLLMKVQSPDITSAFNTYIKARNDELLDNKAYLRSKDLYEHGAIALSALEQAQNMEDDAKADLVAAEGQLDTLGVKKEHPSNVVDVYSPISGVIIAQNVTIAAAAGVNFSGTATAFTVADLSSVWVICDVFENDIPKLKLGQTAQIKLNAYPDKVIVGLVSDIGPVLDPNLRTAKVRIEVPNPGLLMKVGMFVTATFESRTRQQYAVVPQAAVLHLHDRDWIFIPAEDKKFKRVEVHTGDSLPGNKVEIISGINPGQQVVSNVLQLEATLEAQQ